MLRNSKYIFFVYLLLPLSLSSEANIVSIAQKNEYVRLNPKSEILEPNFYFYPVIPRIGQEIKFYNASIGDPENCLWNFGDGLICDCINPVHVYHKPSIYYITLKISKGEKTKTKGKYILILSKSDSISEKLVADFIYEPQNPKAGVPIKFYDKSSGVPIKRTWKFGYFGISLLANPVKTFFVEGKYAVTLEIEDNYNSDKKTKYIEVGKSPIDTIRAKSCSLSDVQAAIAEANPGDTVIVPAGRATWDKNLIIRKGITLKGMGIDSTVITCNYNGTGEIMNPGGYFITYEPSSPEGDQPFRLTGFTFNLNNKSGTGGLLLRNPTSYHQTKIRIDHTKWDNVVSGGNIWWIYGYFWGVADNNHFDTPGRFRFYALDSITWSNEIFTFGSANNFYMEDNFIRAHNDDFFYLEAAGRLALRYNTLYFDVQSSGYYPVVDVHGNQPTAWSAAMGFEGYGNEIYAAFGMRLIDMRAGRNLFYNNKITQSSGSSTISASEEYYDSNNPPAHAPDGQPQHVSDSYVFNNYRNGSVLIADFPYTGSQLYYSDEGYYVPTEDLHYWKHNIKFNGSSGVGVGLMSQRPSSCSKEGVAWWSTDENKLYRWKNGRWELYYTPYIYPHPLRTILGD
ncbi:MAG: PKD domain-containing protein [Candidatus Saccharicenans sp.]|nr:PKD domain-containing protein [Candidatus Saccharicenans sp.]MDH7575631.1 PKD domain-containing protein [Candidatus Saccharicenans sp.]